MSRDQSLHVRMTAHMRAELERLAAKCRQGKTVSDLIRDAVQVMLDSPPPDFGRD